jgi:peptidoglycan/xylan/chitin deacetylase (PgdA/CDA1 family)
MTMDPFALSQSPRTQAFQQPQGPEDEEELFSKGFSDLAYRAFQKSHPELYEHLITFRVLNVDASAGEGIGAFILKVQQDILFVPAIIADNAIKPLDMFYARAKDRFYPLTSEWIGKATSGGVSGLGEGIEPPKDLNTDVDIRNVVVPPTTGRYSYAEANGHDPAWEPFVAAQENEKRASDEPLVFPELIGRLPNHEKVAYASWLEDHADIFKKMAEVYGVKTLAKAFELRPETQKTAAEFRKEVPKKHDVYLAVSGTPLEEIRKVVGAAGAAEAYKALRYHGFYIKDLRKTVPNTVATKDEETLALTSPEYPGVYRVYLADGTNTKAIVIPNPVGVEKPYTDHQSMAYGAYNKKFINDFSRWHEGHFLVLLPDGRAGVLSQLIAEPVVEDSHGEIEALLKTMTKEAPANKQEGVLVSSAGMTLRGTAPFCAEKVVSHGDVTSLTGNYDMSIVLSKKLRGTKIVKPADQNTMVFPNSYRWFPVKGRLSDRDVLSRPQLVGQMIDREVEKTGALRIKVARAQEGYLVGDAREKLTAVEAVVKVANEYGVSVGEATNLVEAVANGLPVTAWVMPKYAQGEQAGAPPGPPVGPDGQPMDPSMMGGMPPAPPPPSGIDLAIAEKMQTIQAQRAALDQMEQMLSELQGRAQGIDQGGGAMAAPMGAASMAAGPQQGMMGQPQMAPVPGMGGPQGMDPSMMGGVPPQGGMDPSMMGGMPPGMGGGMPPGMGGGMPPGMGGMDPNMMSGGMPPGMDPNAMQGQAPPPPPQPVMPSEPNPAQYAEQVSPQFQQEAAQLDQDGVFDAASVASLANVRSIRSLLQNYTPTLDNALDRLGRTLLLLYVKSKQIRDRIGEEAYTALEQVVRDVFRMLGDALMSLEQYGDQMLPSSTRAKK